MQGFSAGCPATIQSVSFLAGFVEGEASLRLCEQNGGQSFGCQMVLNQRDDEQDTLERLLASTGLGRLRRVAARLTSKPQISWIVDSQDDCRALLVMLEPCGFHGRRAVELDIWRRAVHAWTETSGETRRSALRALKAELVASRMFGAGARSARPFAGRSQLLGYISGFVSAEGCFTFSGQRPRFCIHLRADDRPLLDLLAEATGLGRVTDYRPGGGLNPSSAWTISGAAQLAALRDLLCEADLAGRKRRQMDAWAAAVDEVNRPSPQREVLDAARERLAAVRAYQPQRTALLQLPGRDLRQESLDALIAWSCGTARKLACTDYMRWRLGRAEAPSRNTIVRQFGTWHAALEAAGLRDRAARAPRPIGGEVRRAVRRTRQRERVIAAVRAFEREHGRLPRALEFFRWRYDQAVDAPTQGSIYRLFPGGWPEVLALV